MFEKMQDLHSDLQDPRSSVQSDEPPESANGYNLVARSDLSRLSHHSPTPQPEKAWYAWWS